MADEVQLECRDGVAVITLNRPTKLNAWTARMRESLVGELLRAGKDDAVTAVVLTGTGRGFCAGQDLAETALIDPTDHAAAERWIDGFDTLYHAVLDLDKPVVAAVNGVAAGSGFQYALLADLRIGHAGVRMGQPEILSGIPSITGIWAMWSILGRAKTTEFVMTGALVEADEALRLGLLTKIVAEDEVLSASVELARRLGALPQGAMRSTKGRLRELENAALEDAFVAAKRVHSEAYASGEPQREMKRFVEKP